MPAEEVAPPRLDEPRKSYAEAAVEPPPAQAQANGVGKSEEGGEEGAYVNGSKSNGASTPPNHVDPHKSYAEAAVEPTPPSTNGSLNVRHNGSLAKSPGEYSGNGILDLPPTSPTRSSFRKPRTRNSRSDLKDKEKENQRNYHSPQKSQSTTSLNSEDTLYESYHHNGQLTSIKPPEGYEENLALDERERKVKKQSGKSAKGEQELQIASGRIAAEGWERSGIRWAPLNVPLKRRMQTFMVLLHTLSICLTLGYFFWACAIPLFWPLLIPYLFIVLTSKASTDGSLSTRSPWFRRQKIWSLFASYFPARLHRTTELPPTRKYIFGYHPHGIISHGAFAAFATEALGFASLFPGITNTLLTLDNNFRVPFYRDYLLRLGINSVSRESCENLLSRGGPNNEGMGRGITIVVGGARESLETQPGTLRLVLDSRKGFIKLAIRTGADLVPVLGFGENDIYEQISPQDHPFIHKMQLAVKKVMGFTVPLFHARGIFNYDVGIMPYRRPMNIVVGRPVKVIKDAKPSEQYVREIHEQYCRELQWIWDSFKDTFAKERTGELEVVG